MRYWTLKRLGFASYSAYLKSAHWQDIRARYARSDRPQGCGLCGGDKDLDLHHLTYERLGHERLTDVVRLCRRCHVMVHVLEKRGDASISLDGIIDLERARIYLAQRVHAVERARQENAQPRTIGYFDKASQETAGLPPTKEERDRQRSQARLRARRRRKLPNPTHP